MKRILLLLIVALYFFNNSQAQLPDGSLAPDFTLTDLSGTSHNLYSLLDDGYTVFIEFTAVWCPPCWNYHTSGALANLYLNHGPFGYPNVSANTTDDVMVFFIEADGGTLSELQGGGNSEGDWIIGTPYPILPTYSGSNPAQVTQDYQIGYFPTVYMICPDRILTETGAIQNPYSAVNCPAPASNDNDARTFAYAGETLTCDGDLVPEIMIQNYGLVNLTSLSIEVSVNGNIMYTTPWTGNLATYATDNITLPALTALASNDVVAINTTYPNGTVDADLSNNPTVAFNVELATQNTNTFVTVQIVTDNYGSETTWDIKDANGAVVLSGGPYNNLTGYGTTTQTPTSGILATQTCHTFTIYDSYGDGIDDGYGAGTFTVTDGDGTILSSGGQFTDVDGDAFKTGNNTSNSIYDIVSNSNDHTTLKVAIDACALDVVLSDPGGSFTLFAPTDAAFNLLPAGTVTALLNNIPQLTDILMHHVVGDSVTSFMFSNNQVVTTLLGTDVTVTINANGVFIDNAQVIIADIVADNGVVHVIDAVIGLSPILGCTDLTAFNYNPVANVDDGSCVYYNYGCFNIAHSAQLSETTIGTTTYDLQSNASLQNRIVVHDDGTISAGWTMSQQYNTTYSDRGTGYNFFDGTSWGAQPTTRLEYSRGGWPSIIALGNGGECAITHNTDNSLVNNTFRANIGSGSWTENTITPDYLLWNRSASGGNDGNTIHMIGVTASTAFGGLPFNGLDGALVYYRSQDGGITWDITNLQLPGMDTSMYYGMQGDHYAISAKGETVVVAYFDDWGDSYIVKSIDNGDTWTKTIFLDFPVDKYATDDGIDLSADGVLDRVYSTDNYGTLILDDNGNAHVFYGVMQYADDDLADASFSWYPSTNGIAYWTESFGPDNTPPSVHPGDSSLWYSDMMNDHWITKAPDINGDGVVGGIDDLGGYALYYASRASMPSAGIDSSGALYLSFSGYTETADNGTQVFRHIYVTKSEDGGTTWSCPVDVTPHNDWNGMQECVFGSMSPVVDDKIRILYQKDFEPGLSVQGDGDMVDNNWITYLEVSVSVFDTSIIYGCSDPTATNYDPNATNDDGSCIICDLSTSLTIMNPTSPTACDGFAFINATSSYSPINFTWFNINNNIIASGVNFAQNLCHGAYYIESYDSVGCLAVDTFIIGDLYGCTDPAAYNYDPLANIDDGSCISVVNGCTDSSMFNYNSSANIDDGSCTPFIYGCTDPTALNYDASANTDDGSCQYCDLSISLTVMQESSPSVCDGWVFINASSSNTPISHLWSTGSTANNIVGLCSGTYTLSVTDAVGCIIDTTIIIGNPAEYGCTDPTADNYDASATTDDGSCAYSTVCTEDAPTGLFVDGIIHSRAVINWDNMNSSTCTVDQYRIRYRVTGTSSWTNKTMGGPLGSCAWGNQRIDKLLLGLTGATTYEYQMKAWYCGGGASSWTSLNNFTTADNCPNVGNLTAYGANPTKATFTWDDSNGPYEFVRLKSRIDSISNPSGSDWFQIGGAGVAYGTFTKNKNGLVPGETYRAQARAFCDPNGGAYFSLSWSPLVYWTQPTSRIEGGTAIANLDIYPNPSRDVFNISFTSETVQDLKVRILNVVGEVIISDDLEQFVGEYTKQINLEEHAKGIYFLDIETNDGMVNKKLILQ